MANSIFRFIAPRYYFYSPSLMNFIGFCLIDLFPCLLRMCPARCYSQRCFAMRSGHRCEYFIPCVNINSRMILRIAIKVSNDVFLRHYTITILLPTIILFRIMILLLQMQMMVTMGMVMVALMIVMMTMLMADCG